MQQPRLRGSVLKQQEAQQNPAAKPSPKYTAQLCPEWLYAPWGLLLHQTEAVGGLCLTNINIHSAEASGLVELLGSHLCQRPSPVFPPQF